MSETNPPAWAVERAWNLVTTLTSDTGLGWEIKADLINAIASALTVPDGHVRLPSGEDALIPMTADGKLCESGDRLYHPKYPTFGKVGTWGSRADTCRFYFPSPSGLVMEWADVSITECYSTPAAAESARSGGGA